MRVVLATLGDPGRNHRLGSMIEVLRAAGHEITIVSPPVSAPVEGIAHVQAPLRGDRRLFRRKVEPVRAIARIVDDLEPDLIYPLRSRDIEVFDAMDGGWGVADPSWGLPIGRDLAWAPLGAMGLAGTWQSTDIEERTPIEGRTVNIVARFTATTPARYLAHAFETLGARVNRWDGGIDWAQSPHDAALTLFVESPYPALEVEGEAPKHIPTLFWAHHGEHHQRANIRLSHRYGADAVLMAHSWHLAHQFAVPVYALPFGVPTELLPESVPPPLSDRRWDVAMVGAGLEATTGWYAARAKRIAAIRDREDIESCFLYGVAPDEMVDLYADARVVLNDGGSQHRPITMRVFEALGVGSVLATEPAPGLSHLFTEGEHYVVLHTDGADEILDILSMPALDEVAAAGRREAMAHNTYRHRAERIASIAAEIATDRRPVRSTPTNPVGAVVDADVDVQSILIAGVPGDLALMPPDRDCRLTTPDDSYGAGSFDAVVITRSWSDPSVASMARGYVYTDWVDVRPIEALLDGWGHTRHAGVDRFDSGIGGYRVRPDDHPLT